MNLVLKILIGLVCLLFLSLGVPAMFAPESMTAQLGLSVDNLTGLSTLRGDIGGMFMACVVMLVLGLVRGETLWFLAVALMMLLIALGRGIGLVVDGVDQTTVTPFVTELIIAALLIVAHRRLAAPA